MDTDNKLLPAGETSVPALTEAEWRAACAFLPSFDTAVDAYLEVWTRLMDRAGYLEFTTARNEDCIAASRMLLEAIFRHSMGGSPTFDQLQANSDGWADSLLAAGRRHRRRGVKTEIFLDCFILFIEAMKDTLRRLRDLDLQESAPGLAASLKALDLYGAAFISVWQRESQASGFEQPDPDELLRLMALNKCRFENILAAASDCILTMNSDCRITLANRALNACAGGDVSGQYVWEALKLDIKNSEEFFDRFAPGKTVEIAPFGRETIFRMSISSLADVSLASASEYFVLLTNITQQVLERRKLEAAVAEQTRELRQEKRRLEEMNITLGNVLNHLQKDREQKLKEAAANIRHFLAESLGLICADPDPARRRKQAFLLGEQIDRLLWQGESSEARLASLTLTELKICKLIAAGHQSKTIGEILNISSATVQTHRKHIRRKLGIRGNAQQLVKDLAEIYKT